MKRAGEVQCQECGMPFAPKKEDLLQLCSPCIKYNGIGSTQF